ncbi:hypothetical protein EJP617_07420 [Erwinia sp. Ejp617]|nr:hypothetical protein EJP617_07420 [Erwinia sp. Ejp617]
MAVSYRPFKRIHYPGAFSNFRIWFVLQRYNQFAFKPFMTNMEATVEITGGRHAG